MMTKWFNPISKAKISIISDENGIQETISDFKGDFSPLLIIDHVILQQGYYKVFNFIK